MNIRLTADLAALLIQTGFNLAKEDFFVTGSLVVGSDLAKDQAADVDFVVTEPTFDKKLMLLRDWKESEYFVGQSFKTVVDGITFNAVVLSATEYEVWRKATEAMSKTPNHMRGRTKPERLSAFEFFLSYFRGF